MTEQDLADLIGAALAGECEALDGLAEEGIDNPGSYRSFRQAGLLTGNSGIVVRFSDGSEYQISVVQSRSAEISGEDDEDEEDE